MSVSLRLVLWDQLTIDGPALRGLDPSQDVVLMIEADAEARIVPHHKQKLVLLWSAMRHFAEELTAAGIAVDYVRLDEPDNTGTIATELERAIDRHAAAEVITTEPGDWRLWRQMLEWRETLPVPVHIRPDDRFICSREAFARWADGRKSFRMEFFYREMRRATGLLMQDGQPVGGQWNFDAENRKRLPRGHRLPDRLRFAPDPTTRAVMDLVADRYADHFGDLQEFGWAVTRADALAALEHFITDCLPDFGDYQDAMKADEDFLHHGLISSYLNCGLLTAREVCDRAEAAWAAGRAPLNAVEGFIRQILGWREYVRGIYWAQMPGYAATNRLQASRPLPDFYWTGNTRMRCLAQCIGTTRRHAYAHHIQRLMVLGNFALLAGIAPAEIEAWFLLVYADAHEWVELPNVHGMVMHADGGLLGSKPYAASGAYIDRMSDYCGGCAYDVKQRTGPDACPFNALYWNFLIEHEAVLAGNPRMAMPYRNLQRMATDERQALTSRATEVLEGLA